MQKFRFWEEGAQSLIQFGHLIDLLIFITQPTYYKGAYQPTRMTRKF